jgi:hypothetical protein
MVDPAQKRPAPLMTDARPRFSLRSAVGIICIVSVFMAYWSHQIRSQEFVIREVERRGGEVWNVKFDEGGAIAPPYPSWLSPRLYSFVPKSVNYIYLTGDTISDDDLEIVTALPTLEGLNLSASSVTDSGLKRLESCARLKELQLYDVATLSPEAIDEFKRAVPLCQIQR